MGSGLWIMECMGMGYGLWILDSRDRGGRQNAIDH